MAKTDGPWMKDKWTLIAERGARDTRDLETYGMHFKTEAEARERLELFRPRFHYLELIDPTGEIVEIIGTSVFSTQGS